MKKRLFGLLLVLVLCVEMLAGVVNAATVDSQPPVIDKDSITISTETATVGDTITVTVGITDNVAISHVHISFWNKDTNEGDSLTMSRVGETDTFSVQFAVKEATPAGTWCITRISAFDTIGNSASANFAYDVYTFTVEGEPESIAIETEDITIDKDRATVGDVVTISVRVRSERKIERVSFYLTNYDAGKIYSYDGLIMQYNDALNCYIYPIEITDAMPSGYWQITDIHASDEYGQGIAMSAVFNKGFTVYGTSADSEKPFIDNSTIAVSNDEIERGRSSIISVQVTDNFAISNVTIGLKNLETGKNIAYPSMCFNEQTNRYEYTFTADDTIPSGHWQLRQIHAVDTSGNYSIQDIIDWDKDYYILVTGENDHVWKTDKAIEPTCTSTGLTEGSSCSICGKINVAQENVDMLEHDFSDNTRYCKNDCGTKNPDYDPCLNDHDFSGNAEYCRNNCGTKNPNYTAPIMPPYTPVRPTPTPVKSEQTENPFNDVNKADYFFDAVIWAVDNGITSGTNATTFEPNKVCSRAEMVTFLWRAAGKPEPINSNNPFIDVTENDYFYKAALWAVENGITHGTSATTFSPNDICTRGQATTFLYRYADSPKAGSANPFDDTQKTDYFFDAVIWAAEEEITKGTSTTTFSPDDFCTRAQIVTFLYRAQK